MGPAVLSSTAMFNSVVSVFPGVTCVLAEDGMSLDLLQHGLKQFEQNTGHR